MRRSLEADADAEYSICICSMLLRVLLFRFLFVHALHTESAHSSVWSLLCPPLQTCTQHALPWAVAVPVAEAS